MGETRTTVPRAYLTTDEVADMFGITKRIVVAAVKSGELPHVRIGQQIRIPVSQLSRLAVPGTANEHHLQKSAELLKQGHPVDAATVRALARRGITRPKVGDGPLAKYREASRANERARREAERAALYRRNGRPSAIENMPPDPPTLADNGVPIAPAPDEDATGT